MKLPDHPAALIRLALENLKMAEESLEYLVDTSEWHRFNRLKGVTEVCLGGAVVAFTLGRNRKKTLEDPAELIEGYKILTLDKIHSGNLVGAGEIWEDAKGPNCWVPEYRKDREGFIKKLEEIANYYESHNK